MKSKRYEKEYLKGIVEKSCNLTEIAENIGLKPNCGNRNTIKKYIQIYGLDTSHFRARYELRKVKKKDLSEILVENSHFNSTNLKERLYNEGLKERKCEKCGQGEEWYGNKMSLILDHINGNHNDNRIENLRIVCPNCNATLPTHGGKNRKGHGYGKKYEDDDPIYFCECGERKDKKAKQCKKCYSKSIRKIKRPTNEQLIKDVNELGYRGTGRKYGVSDNAIRKWLK